MSASLRAVDLPDGIVDGAASLPPLVPDGEYLAVYVTHECIEMRQFGNAAKVFVRLRLYDAGEHTGTVLFRSYRVKEAIGRRRFRLAPRSDLLKMYCRVMESANHRPRLDRMNLRDLRPLLLRVRTRTVTRDYKGRAWPGVLRYSVIDEILGQGA